MSDPNSLPVSIGATTAIVIPAPAATTTLYPPPPHPLGFIMVLGLDLTCTSTGVVTIKSAGGTFPDRILDTIQTVAGGGIAKSVVNPGSGGYYQCDPGSNLSITNSAGTVSGSITYTIKGAP